MNLPYRERPNFVNQTHTVSETNKNATQNYQIGRPGPSFYPRWIENFPRQTNSAESKASSSVYPLYYGLHFPPHNPRAIFPTTNQASKMVIVGTPVYQTVHAPLPPPLTNFFETSFSFNGSKKTNIQEDPPSSPLECDLSLRLGVSGKGLGCVNDVGSGPSSSWVNPQNKEFSFFPLNSEGEEVHNMMADLRKRKANDVVNDGQHLLRLEPDFHQKRRGL